MKKKKLILEAYKLKNIFEKKRLFREYDYYNDEYIYVLRDYFFVTSGCYERIAYEKFNSKKEVLKYLNVHSLEAPNSIDKIVKISNYRLTEKGYLQKTFLILRDCYE